MKSLRHLILLMLCLTTTIATQAQHYSDDFENGYSWYPPWYNIHLLADSTIENQHVSLCDSTMEFGLGFSYKVPDSIIGKNLHIAFQADYRFPDTLGDGQLVFSIKSNENYNFWQSYYLSDYANDSAAWFPVHIELNLPADHLINGTVNAYLWNNQKSIIHIDNATLDITPWQLPSFLPDIAIPRDSVTEDLLFIHLPSDSIVPLTYPIGMLTEYCLGSDSIVEYHPLSLVSENRYRAVSSIDTTFVSLVQTKGKADLLVTTGFFKECHLLRQAVVIPFIDSTLTVYRRNLTEEASQLTQPEYYLDREGFKIGEGVRTVISYHQGDISSTQLDALQRTAYFNLDYWRDHPMIHYPLSDTLEDHFEDRSYRHIDPGMSWEHSISLSVGNEVSKLPRINPLPDGYESGIIFTEHADWTDLRTHRAILFGDEHITKAKDAVGGFVYYGIPMTKSVFYNNPDHVTNDEASHGAFTGLHATIKTHKEFEKLLKQLDKIGYDICLHTPEQYSTTQSNLEEALAYMKKHFKSTTWIDHGYNNGSKHNREDLVCDALNPRSDIDAATLWRKNGITYLWNAYYEENRMEYWNFDNNILQPYPGFGDALPNRQITTIAGYDFLTWSTPSTLDANSDSDWDYYYSDERLQKIVNQHCVHITHVYPAWVNPARAFWTYNEDGTIVALPGMNRALARIAKLRDEGKMLPMTVRTYLDYYSQLNRISYEILDDNQIRISNHDGEIKGFTLLCPAPIRFHDNRFYEFRKSGPLYYVWFDLKAGDQVTITIIND